MVQVRGVQVPDVGVVGQDYAEVGKAELLFGEYVADQGLKGLRIDPEVGVRVFDGERRVQQKNPRA